MSTRELLIKQDYETSKNGYEKSKLKKIVSANIVPVTMEQILKIQDEKDLTEEEIKLKLKEKFIEYLVEKYKPED